MRRLAAAAALLALSAPAAAAARAPRSIMEDDAALLRSGPAVRDRALDEMRALGVDEIRVLAVWRDYAPAARRLRRPAHPLPPARALAPLVDLRAAAAARGLRLLVTPTGPGPAWASGCRGPARARQPCRPSPRLFGGFVAALGRALPRQHAWSVWNEPNAGVWLTPQMQHGRLVSPVLYRRLVFAAAAALARTGHARDELLVGETAPIGHTHGPQATRPTPPGRFVRALLCGLRAHRCAPLPGTGYAHHMYPAAARPVPCTASAPGEFGATGLPSLDRLLRAAAARGLTRRRLGLWITESGVQSAPPDRLFGVPLAEQARDANELEWLAWRAGARSAAQYLLYDERRLEGFQSGLRFFDGRAKPALGAYRMPLWVVRRPGGVRIWARVRPPRGTAAVAAQVEHRRPSGAWHVVRRATLRRRGHVLTASLHADPRGAWRVRAAGLRSRTAAAARPCPAG